jgi:hypothetical protein
LEVCNQPILHRALPVSLQAQINYLNALETMLDDPVRKELWWDPIRRDPRNPPPGVPAWVRVTYLAGAQGRQLKFEPCEVPKVARNRPSPRCHA